MFERRVTRGRVGTLYTNLELIYFSIVASIRQAHGNAFMSLLISILQAFLFVIVFSVMILVIGQRTIGIRGDFVVFLMTGIFLYMTHIKAVGAVSGAAGPTSPAMQHAPMNTIVAIVSAALGALYIQTLSMAVIFYVYHVAIEPFEIYDPIGFYGCFLLAWFVGCSIGMVFRGIKPWFPQLGNILTTFYTRANMIASGKMFVANTLPGFMLAMFDWNPLFHAIDQARGQAFINYSPHHSSLHYPIYVALTLIVIGLMLEYVRNKYQSVSWEARR